METPQKSSNARLPAIVALVAAFVALVVIVASSVGGGGSRSAGGSSAGRSQSARSRQSQSKVYVIKPGDTFSRIAHKVGISVNRLQRLNPNLDQFALHSGNRVKLR